MGSSTNIPLFYLRLSFRQRLRLLFGGNLAVSLEFEGDGPVMLALPKVIVSVEVVK